MNSLEEIIALVFVFASGVVTIFILARYNYLIKKALADRGFEPGKNSMSYAEMGCIVSGTGIGLALSSIFTLFDLPEDTMDLLVWATILVGTGIGFFAAGMTRQKFGKG